MKSSASEPGLIIFKTYTLNENSLSVALIFPIVFGYWRADLNLFFADCVMECLSLLKFISFPEAFFVLGTSWQL